MSQDGHEHALPSSVREGLEQFSNQLADALGEQLVSLILYGSLVKGEYTEAHSDVNVLLVLKEVTVEQLDKVISPVQQGFRDIALAIMVLTEDDLRRSTDVFPIKFQDIKQHHVLLRGKDVLEDLLSVRLSQAIASGHGVHQPPVTVHQLLPGFFFSIQTGLDQLGITSGGEPPTPAVRL